MRLPRLPRVIMRRRAARRRARRRGRYAARCRDMSARDEQIRLPRRAMIAAHGQC